MPNESAKGPEDEVTKAPEAIEPPLVLDDIPIILKRKHSDSTDDDEDDQKREMGGQEGIRRSLTQGRDAVD